MTPEEIVGLEQRSRATVKARRLPVVQEPCPACGVMLAADLARAVKRGEQRCPMAERVRRIFRESLDAIVGGGS